MPHHRLSPSVHEQTNALADALSALRTELELPGEFPEDVLKEAEAAVADRQFPDLDLTGVDFLTIDPPSSTDLDQALFIERRGEGYRILYAIADVPSFVKPGGALDAETRRRGQTFYAPDGRIPLHPEVISENAGSLLAGQLCSAFVWDFELDAAAEVVSVLVRRAAVRSRAKLNYKGVQADLDAGTASPLLQLLREVGRKRVDLERARGGASLNMPEQEIVQLPDGGYRIVAAPQLPVEDWNAQISLMTGMAAASLMLNGKVGILRTMPAPDERSLSHFRRQTAALGKAVGRAGTATASTCAPWIPPTTGSWPSSIRPECSSAEPGTHTLTERSPKTPSSRPSARRTPTPPPRCAASWTGSSWSSARH